MPSCPRSSSRRQSERKERGEGTPAMSEVEVAATSGGGVEADVVRIMQMIPHRYPLLMIDRVIEMYADKGAVGIKNVSMGEPYFQGHFPGAPVMPGVLIVEAMAQTAAVLVVHTLGPVSEGKLVYFMSID